MQVLVLLAEHAGQVIAKERLIHTVWPDTFVTDDVLTRAISELRRVFGDDVKESRFIQTIPKSGYRLIARVSPSGPDHEIAAPGQPVHLETAAADDDHDIADALIELEDASKPIASTRPAADGAAEPSARRRKRLRLDDCRCPPPGCCGPSCNRHGIGFLARRTLAARAQGERCRPPVPEDRGGHGRESSTSGGQVLHAVRPLARRHAARLPRPRQRTIPTLSARAVWVRNQTHSWYRDGNDAVLLTRRPLDRLLASGGSYPPQSLARGRFSDRNCSDRRTDRCALDIERRDRDRKRRSTR